MQSVTIRPAATADIPALMRMKAALLTLEDSMHVHTATAEDWRRDGFGPQAFFHALVADISSVPVGMATYSTRGFPGWKGCAFFLHDLYVEEVFRGLGCARGLMAHLAAEALRQNTAFIELTVDATNSARRFYERIGFTHVAHCTTYIAAQPELRRLAAETEPARKSA
jgi:GNAT superfamily N-acetyltransferase